MATALEKLEKQAELLFENTHGWNTNALKRIGRRIKEIGSLSHADLKALNSATMVKQDINAIMSELAELTKQNASDVIKTYSDFLAEQHLENKPLYDYRNKPFIPFAENKELQAIVRAYAKTTMETMVKLSMTKAKAIGTVSKNGAFIPLEKSFIDVIDRAVMAVATGTGDFGSEMRDTIRSLGGSGMRIDYGGGVTRRVESMVRQNLLWGAKRASKEYNEMIGEELGCDGIEVDWHSNPRPNHEFMQGKQFSLHGKKVIKGVVYEDAQDALSALEDYGCLHFKTPIILGVSEPRYSTQELAKLNAENKREIEIDGIKKTGYYWKQTMRHLEREARYTKEQIELFEASGDVAEVKNLRYKLTAISKRYNKVAEYSGITPQPGRMAYTKGRFINNPKLKTLKQPYLEQNFKAVIKDLDDTISVNTFSAEAKMSRLINVQNQIYLSDKTTLKPKQQHNLDKNINRIKKILKVSEVDNFPKLLVLDSSELTNGTIASYNPINNTLKIDSKLCNKDILHILQKDGVLPNNELSTLVHELYHWKDANKYRRSIGSITSSNVRDYLSWANQRGKSYIDNLQNIGYNIKGISEYARKCYKKGNFDEIYTEYRTLILLGGE